MTPSLYLHEAYDVIISTPRPVMPLYPRLGLWCHYTHTKARDVIIPMTRPVMSLYPHPGLWCHYIHTKAPDIIIPMARPVMSLYPHLDLWCHDTHTQACDGLHICVRNVSVSQVITVSILVLHSHAVHCIWSPKLTLVPSFSSQAYGPTFFLTSLVFVHL